MAEISCLILADGSIATLVAVWREAVCQTSSVSKPGLWLPSGLGAEAVQTCHRIARIAGIGTIVEGSSVWSQSGPEATDMLLSAGRLAEKHGISRLVWPVQFGETDPARRLLLVAGAFDRALLAARLLSVDSRQSGGLTTVIHTPFADLSDAQLVDLGADMDAPIGSAWWCERQDQGPNPCGTCAACLRWLGAIQACGVVPAVAHLAGSLLEEKPGTLSPV